MLTFIIPLYNRAEFIEAAIRSLLRQQDYVDLDILVVNDGSTDSGPAIVESMSREHPAIRMVSTENQGVAKARNVGLRNLLASTQFVSFLDSDDVSPPARIHSDLRELQQDPTLQFTYGKMTLVSELDDATLQPTQGAKQATVRGLSMSAGIYRVEIIRETGMFDESLQQSEDTDYLFRIFERPGRSYMMTDTIAVLYRRHPGNMTRNKQTARRSFMHAVHKSVIRRKNDPSLGVSADIFDFKELMNQPME